MSSLTILFFNLASVLFRSGPMDGFPGPTCLLAVEVHFRPAVTDTKTYNESLAFI